MDQEINRLQKQCIYAGERSVSFHVYSWGAHSNHPDNPLHKHSFFELCYVFGGTGLYYEEGHHYPLTKGMFFCTRPEKLHRVYKGQGLSLFWIGFNVDAASCGEAGVRYAKQMAEAEDLIAHNVEDTPCILSVESVDAAGKQSLFNGHFGLSEPFFHAISSNVILHTRKGL